MVDLRSPSGTRELQPEAFSMIAARFRVLSDPLRLRILHELQAGERNVGELVESLTISQPSISKHLKLLLEANIVSRRQEGTCAYYTIRDTGIFDLCELVCSSLEAQIRSQSDAALRLLGAPRAR